MSFKNLDQINVIVLNFIQLGKNYFYSCSSCTNRNNSCADAVIWIVQHYLGRIFNLPFSLFLQGVPKLLSKRNICILVALINPTWIDTTPPTKQKKLKILPPGCQKFNIPPKNLPPQLFLWHKISSQNLKKLPTQGELFYGSPDKIVNNQPKFL